MWWRSILMFTWLSFSVMAANDNDLQTGAIDSLLQQTLKEQTKQPSKPEVTPARQKEIERDKPASPPAKSKKTAADVFAIPTDGSVDTFNLKREYLESVLSQADNPSAVLQGLISEGTLELSPNDILLLRMTLDQIDQATNKNFVNPKLINDQYMIDHKDRYKTYEIFIHDSGETLIEFLDINGEPWPIYDHSDNENVNIRLGEDHMLWMSPKTKYREFNFFVTLKEYKNPIQFVVKYSNEKRHGLATFKLPYVSPTSTLGNSKTEMGPKVSLRQLANQIPSAGAANQGIDITFEELSYLASTGRFREGSEMARSAVNVLVSDPSLAQVWFVQDKFVVRTPYNLYRFDEIVNAGGAMKVFVSSTLNTVVPINTGSEQVSLYIPDYHKYVRPRR